MSDTLGFFCSGASYLGRRFTKLNQLNEMLCEHRMVGDTRSIMRGRQSLPE